MEKIKVFKGRGKDDIFDEDDHVINIMTPSSFSAKKHGLGSKTAFLYKGFPMYLDRTVLHVRKEDKAKAQEFLKEGNFKVYDRSEKKYVKDHTGMNRSFTSLETAKGKVDNDNMVVHELDDTGRTSKVHMKKKNDWVSESVELDESRFQMPDGFELVPTKHPLSGPQFKAFELKFKGKTIGKVSSHETTSVQKKNSIRRVDTGKRRLRWEGKLEIQKRGYSDYKNKNDAVMDLINIYYNHINESIETVDELSDKKMYKYANKAFDQYRRLARKGEKRTPEEEKKLKKRAKGVSLAAHSMFKEEDQVDENLSLLDRINIVRSRIKG